MNLQIADDREYLNIHQRSDVMSRRVARKHYELIFDLDRYFHDRISEESRKHTRLAPDNSYLKIVNHDALRPIVARLFDRRDGATALIMARGDRYQRLINRAYRNECDRLALLPQRDCI